MARHGRAIRYTPGPRYPIETYQTVFASVPGSAEMPSAGRPFTRALVTSAIAGGVIVVPITLHAGVSSFEDHEGPGEERYRVPASTAAAINALRSSGGRVVAVGTTVVRALETVADEAGNVHPGEGTTDLVVGPERGLRATDALITGWHEPRSSHLRLLEALAGHEFLGQVYDEAIEHGYLWHEFGDSALFMP
jgi:S-adenosylmethionine:tRNA ribosyltransferase-isomerase